MPAPKKPRAPRKPKAQATVDVAAVQIVRPPDTHEYREPFNGVDPAKFDHDGDGKPGGSKPKTLTDHELTGLFAEAFEAYDYMDERVRFDSLNRKWTFRPDKAGDNSVLWLCVSRIDQAHDDTISTAVLASDLGKPMIEDVVRKLSGACG